MFINNSWANSVYDKIHELFVVTFFGLSVDRGKITPSFWSVIYITQLPYHPHFHSSEVCVPVQSRPTPIRPYYLPLRRPSLPCTSPGTTLPVISSRNFIRLTRTPVDPLRLGSVSLIRSQVRDLVSHRQQKTLVSLLSQQSHQMCMSSHPLNSVTPFPLSRDLRRTRP